MSDDETTPDPPPTQEAPEELPTLLSGALESLRGLPNNSRHIETLVPTLVAAWRAGERGVALSTELRHALDGDEPLRWPEELSAEFIDTLSKFADTLPGIDEAIPIATELMELGDQHLDTETTRGIVVDVLTRLEAVAEKILYRLLTTAFFSPRSPEESTRTRHLLRLFRGLEEFFDRALRTWLEHQAPETHS